MGWALIMNSDQAAYKADISELVNCLELLRKAGLNVITIVDGDKPVAYLVPVPLFHQDVRDSGYGLQVMNLGDDFNQAPNED